MSEELSKADLLRYARDTYLFEGLEEELVQGLLDDLSLVCLAPGENLFRQGEESDSSYLVIDGTIDVAMEQSDGKEHFVGEVAPGEWVGEIGVFTAQDRLASAYAKDAVRLVRMTATGFGRVISANEEAFAKVGGTIRQRLLRNQLTEMLPSLFGELDEETLDHIEEESDWVRCVRGSCLMRFGDPGDSMYFLIRGRLEARIPKEDGESLVVGEISPGETVGEMSMFTGDARTADVVAVRDSVLVKFSKGAFNRLTERYPLIIKEITKVIIGRLQRWMSTGPAKRNVVNIAILPLNSEVPVQQFTERFIAGLRQCGSVAHCSSATVESSLGVPDIADADSKNPLSIKLTAWLDQQEVNNDFVVYQTDREMSKWTQKSIRQADRILLVAHASDDPAVSDMEERISEFATVRKDLVLLHPDGRKAPKGTIKWLEPRTLGRHHHVRWTHDSDIERVARFVAGKAVGLCLGGGGARGFAHFGVLRTMEEEGVPIDAIGGNSIGAYVSAIYAHGLEKKWSVRTMSAATKKIFARWFLHVTPPITSMVADGILVHDIKECLGNTQIEDLWIPFFCVSSNLTRAEVKTHTTGALWKAVRTSGGLPGLLPPVVYDGDLHIDGALLNNLPIDVMSQAIDGGEVIGIDVSPLVDMSDNESHGDSLSGWDIIFSKMNPLADKVKMPSLPTIMQRSAEIGAVQNLRGVVDQLADLYISMPVETFDILGFRSAEKISKVGYFEAQKSMKPWLEKRRQIEGAQKVKAARF